MATTKIWPVKGRLDHLINYVLNPSKTEQQFFATGINCTPASAIAEMNATKQLFGKTGGTVAFHAYQSFTPGEATPEIAHEIGARLARELWGDSFQIVVTTHLDKGHIHNHIAINSVGFTDGLRFHSDAKLYRSMRQRSDALCTEYGLSVIENPKPGKARHYGEWNAEREGKPTWRAIVKQDVDEAIDKAMTDKQFFANLRNIGYEVKQGKDISVRPPGKERFLRLARNFGDEYTYEGIAARILRNRRAQSPIAKAKASTPTPKKMPPLPKGSIAKLYRHYLYLFGFYAQRDPNKRMHFLLAEDLRNLVNIVRESALLDERGISTSTDLCAHMDSLESEIKNLCAERKVVRAQLRKTPATESSAQEDPRIVRINQQLRTLRREVRHCTNIAKRSGVLAEKITEMERQQEAWRQEKEASKDGRIGTGGRADSSHDARR
ncbi:relaxase/mobilization nuclease domain-containing protein [Gordonibacter sp.]|uniref:relaxase/mobilization nuclease domain-containing protein n=1 Tax=Gordonibacter sp. TaxID=1968902 RepID=UPI002FC71033